MSATHYDSTLVANLPVLDDSALHADFAHIVGPLERGRDITETCPVYESDDEEAPDDSARPDVRPPAPPKRARARTPAAPAPTPRKRKRGATPPVTPVRPVHGQRSAPASSAITVQQCNPKKLGSASHRRYENYKRARSRDEFLALGGSAADLNHDSRKGFVVSGSPQRAIQRRTAEGQQ